MIDLKNIKLKVDALKAIIERDSISPMYLGSLLDEFISLLYLLDSAADSLASTDESIKALLKDRTDIDNALRGDLTEESSIRADADSRLNLLINSLSLNVDSRLKEIKAMTVAAREEINNLVGADASEAIDNFNEILSFLDGLKDTDSLKGLLSELRRGIRDNENALSVHRTSQNRHLRSVSYEAIDTVDCANPGVYTLKETDGGYGETEDDTWGRWWFLVCSWGTFVGNDIDPGHVNTAFQTLFGHDGIRFRTGRIEGFTSSGNFTGVSWDEWQPLSEALSELRRGIRDNESLLASHRADSNRHIKYVGYERLDTVACAEPGVYRLKETDGGYGETEDDTWGRWWFLVCSWGTFVGNDIDPGHVNTAFQTLFGHDGIKFRTGRIEGFTSSGNFTGISWDEWQPLSESLPDISRRLENLEKVAEKFRVIPVTGMDGFHPDNYTEPGWYYLTLPPAGLEDMLGTDVTFMLVVTRARNFDGSLSLFQWCYTSLGIKLRHGRQDKYGTAWEPFQTIGGGTGQPELGITYYTDAEIDAIAAASESEAEV